MQYIPAQENRSENKSKLELEIFLNMGHHSEVDPQRRGVRFVLTYLWAGITALVIVLASVIATILVIHNTTDLISLNPEKSPEKKYSREVHQLIHENNVSPKPKTLKTDVNALVKLLDRTDLLVVSDSFAIGIDLGENAQHYSILTFKESNEHVEWVKAMAELTLVNVIENEALAKDLWGKTQTQSTFQPDELKLISGFLDSYYSYY